jgi:Lysozyme like domain
MNIGGYIALAALGTGGIFLLMTLSSAGKLSFTQLVTLAQNAGFSGSDALIAAAIALAESGGDPAATGDWTLNGKIVPKNTPGAYATSYGLWQIHWTVHPEFDQRQLFDPQYNANAAFLLWQRRGDFTDWTTYTNDKYLAYLPSVMPDIAGSTG